MYLQILPADQFTIEELTDFYNQTRVDYLVPMPMSVDVMAEYIHDFDVDTHRSIVITDGENDQALGLGMLGIRDTDAWVTRLGVIPSTRRHGTGATILNGLLDESQKIGAKKVILEVIKKNTPARNLFSKNGFRETNEYLVLRRAPLRSSSTPEGHITWLYRKDALAILRTYPHRLTWINAIRSMENASMFQGFAIELPNGSRGWMIFRHKKHSITHFVFHTEQGDPVEVARNLLLHLHQHYHRMDAYAENFLADDPHLPAFFNLGYFEAFRRIEMIRDNTISA